MAEVRGGEPCELCGDWDNGSPSGHVCLCPYCGYDRNRCDHTTRQVVVNDVLHVNCTVVPKGYARQVEVTAHFDWKGPR